MPPRDRRRPPTGQAAPQTRIAQAAGRPMAIVMLAATLGLCHSVAAWAAAGERPASAVTVAVHQGLLTVDARNAPLADVLRLMGEGAGLRVKIDDAVGGLITDSFSAVPLDQGIERLARGLSFVLMYASGGCDRRLAEVWVLAPSKVREEPPRPVSRGRAAVTASAPSVPSPAAQQRAERLKAIEELARPGDEDAAAALARILEGETDPLIRAKAEAALNGFGGAHVAAALTSALRDQDPSVRLEAVADLSPVSGPMARTALAGALVKDPDPRVRLQAAQALAL